jgi:hypothetical protein
MTAPHYREIRTVLEEVERYLDSADRLFASGKLLEAQKQVRRARAVIYSHLDGGHAISQTTLHSWRPWYVRRGRLGKLTGLHQNGKDS